MGLQADRWLARRELVANDAELARVARSTVSDRLALGEALDALGERFKELGFRTFGMYVRERLSLGPRWCADTRALARRLAERPALREALLTGRIGWSMAELLARGSTPGDAAELLEACAQMTVREVRSALRTRLAGEAPPPPKVQSIEVAMTATERLALEATRVGIEHVDGGPGETGRWLEHALAEAHVQLLAMPGAIVDEPMHQPAGSHEADEPPPPPSTRAEVAAPAPLTSTDPNALDAEARSRSCRLASREARLGQLLGRFFAGHGWRRLGYASEQQYCDERLGMSRASARKRVRLAQQDRWLEGLMAAVQDGRLGMESAQLLARVASPDTFEAWVARAQARTYKHLREEVRAVELAAELSGARPSELEPPTREELALVESFERDVISGESIARAVRDAQRPEDESVQTSGGDEPVQMSGRAERRRLTRLRARVDVIDHYRALERAFERTCIPMSFPMFVATAFWTSWSDAFFVGNKWKALHDRDRHRCVSPVCESRSLTNHHVRYRAHGGGDELDNQITLCEFCHLEGEHGGRLKVRGSAGALRWDIGRRPVLRVEGRRKV